MFVWVSRNCNKNFNICYVGYLIFKILNFLGILCVGLGNENNKIDVILYVLCV